MITVKKIPAGARTTKNLRHQERVENVVVPEGYLTGGEFVSECKSFVTTYFQKNGLL